ncbi:MAG: mannose-6-phosphate isomerase, class I [Agrococcus sp.]
MLVRIANEPRDYAWGSETAIPEYLGRPETGGPQAELWLGAHPGCPARVDGRPLDAALADAGLPQPRILLKVLAAARPLSLQVHPTAEQAVDGFAREEAAGVPLDAPTRTYRDRHAKPELIVAVTPFEALSGFRPLADSLPVLDALAAVDDRVAPLVHRAGASLRDAVAWLLSDAPDRAPVVEGIVIAAERLPDELAAERDTVRRVAAFAPGDPAVAIALLLHRVSLAPGEALFLDAGNLHAYLEGLAIELMAPSDNVVRGGMTPKHIDRDELLRILDLTPLDDPRLPAEPLDGATRWAPAAPFELRHIEGAHTVGAADEGLLLALSDTAVHTDDGSLGLRRGEAAYASRLRGATVESDDAWLALAV